MKVKTLILLFITALGLASCNIEMDLAKRYVAERQNIRAAVYFPEQAKVTLIQSEQGAYSKVLDSLDQDAFLDIMYASYADALRSYEVDVYIPEDQNNVVVDSTHWLVVLSQIEIQGLITPYPDVYFDLSDSYEFTVPLNTVNVAAWFDINDGEWLPTYYYEHNLMEDFQSEVVMDSKRGPQYHYDIVPIRSGDVYNYAVFLGKKYADYTYNEMLNRFIQSEMLKDDLYPRFKLCWDPQEKRFFTMEEEEGFIEVRGER